MLRTDETRHIKWHETFVNVNVDLMKVFVITNNVGIMINADVNVNNWLT